MENLNSLLLDPFFLMMFTGACLASLCASSIGYCFLSVLKEFGWKNDRKIRMRFFGYFFVLSFTIIMSVFALNLLINLVNHQLAKKCSESKKYNKDFPSAEIEQP